MGGGELHTVLLVEDDPEVREVLGDVLTGRGLFVLSAEDGRHGLAQLQECGRPDMILLDLLLPDMDGGQFLVAMRAMPGFADVPVVVLTGARGLERKLLPVDTVGAWLTKPVRLDDLLRAMTSVHQKARAGRARPLHGLGS